MLRPKDTVRGSKAFAQQVCQAVDEALFGAVLPKLLRSSPQQKGQMGLQQTCFDEVTADETAVSQSLNYAC